MFPIPIFSLNVTAVGEAKSCHDVFWFHCWINVEFSLDIFRVVIEKVQNVISVLLLDEGCDRIGSTSNVADENVVLGVAVKVKSCSGTSGTWKVSVNVAPKSM